VIPLEASTTLRLILSWISIAGSSGPLSIHQTAFSGFTVLVFQLLNTPNAACCPTVWCKSAPRTERSCSTAWRPSFSGTILTSTAAVFVLRRKLLDAHRPYRMWGYPYTLWLFVAVSVWFMADALVTRTLPSMMAILIVATGVGAFRIWRLR